MGNLPPQAHVALWVFECSPLLHPNFVEQILLKKRFVPLLELSQKATPKDLEGHMLPQGLRFPTHVLEAYFCDLRHVTIPYIVEYYS